MKTTWMMSSVLLAGWGFAAHLDRTIGDDIASLRAESHLTSMSLQGESENGGRCFVQIEISSVDEVPYFAVSVNDTNVSYSMPLHSTPLNQGNKAIASDYVHIEEAHTPSMSGYYRYATLSSIANAGTASAYPTEVEIGETQLQPVAGHRQLRCYSLRPL